MSEKTHSRLWSASSEILRNCVSCRSISPEAGVRCEHKNLGSGHSTAKINFSNWASTLRRQQSLDFLASHDFIAALLPL